MAHHEHHRPTDYASWLQGQRGAKDAAFKTQHWSPIPHEARHGFTGLNYYAPEESYRQTLKLKKHDEPKTLDMQTSTGDAKRYSNVGHFTFDVEGVKVDIQAYLGPDKRQLFVPMRDKTSGKETYGAGRYLDLEWEGPDAEYTLDLNLLYNPYCAYNEAYSCPLPPPENWLQVPIPVGEKNWK